MKYVCIDGIDDDRLAFFGYERIADGPEFTLYRHHYTGEEQIVAKSGKRYLYIDDRNDAMWLSATHAVEIPESLLRRN